MLFNDATHIPAPRQPKVNTLLSQHQVGLRFIPYGTGSKHRQNFALIRPTNPIGSAIFIHGRELFSPETAELYFDGQGELPYAAFGLAAKEKLRHYLSPEGLQDRFFDYKDARDHASNVRNAIEHARSQWPDIGLPAFPPITQANASQQLDRLHRYLEFQGVDLAGIDKNAYFPDEPTRSQTQATHREKATQFLHRLESQLQERYPGRHDAWMEELESRLERFGWDPQIVENFRVGLTTNPPPDASVESIIAAGIEIQTEAILHEAARSMSNPYAADFLHYEKEIANTAAASLSNRIFNLFAQSGIPLIATNAGQLDNCADLLGNHPTDWHGAAGAYLSAIPLGGKVNKSFIAVTSAYSPGLLAELIRHEVEHMFDLTKPQPLSTHSDAVSQAITRDHWRLQETNRELANASPKQFSPFIQRLAETCGYKTATEEDRTIALQELRQDMQELNDRCRRFFEPGSVSLYQTRHSQLREVAPVMAAFKGEFGAAFTRAVLPDLYALFMANRVQDPRLRNPGAGVAR